MGRRAWSKDDPEALAVRAVGRGKDPTDPSDPTDRSDLSWPYSGWLQNPDSGVVANAVICLIHQANYLLDRQIRALERDFVLKGGYSERLSAARRAQRDMS